jgi:hypothetical protein
LLATQEGLHEAGADFNWLDLSNTAVTDAGVRQLAACDQLEYLFLNGTAVSDAGFKTAARLPNLKIISVEGARVSPEALAGIRAERPQLRITPAGGK